MAIKVSYTEEEVKQYMMDVLGDTATKQGWSVEDADFEVAADEVLYSLGKQDFTFVNSVETAAEMRAVARVEVWRMAMANSAHLHSHSVGAPGTGQTSRSDVYRQLKEQFDLAVQYLTDKFPGSAAVTQPVTASILAYPVEYENEYNA